MILTNVILRFNKQQVLMLCYILFLSLSQCFYAQNEFNQIKVDSLKRLYNTDKENENVKELLSLIAQDETNPEEKLHYANLLIAVIDSESNQSSSKQESILHYKSRAYLQKGNALQLKGEFHEALDAYFKCMDTADKEGDEELSASVLVSIADTYSMIGNSERAEEYYDEAISLLRKIDDPEPLSLASALLNAGDEYLKTEQYDKALTYFEESGVLFDLLEYSVGKAYNKGNIGMVFAKQGKHELAKSNINEAIEILEEIEDYYPISVFLSSMSDIYSEQNDFNSALSYAQRSLELAELYNLKDQISESNLQLSNLLEQSGKPQKALDRYRAHIVYRDSLLNLENVQKMANSEVTRKELEVVQEKLVVENLKQKRKNQRIVFWSTVGISLLIGFLALGLFKRNKFIHKTQKIIAVEKEISDNLLLNILPEETAKELKEHGKVKARRFEAVTVLFSDFRGFTKYAEELPPEVLVETVDHYFSEFDRIMEKHNLEKIKTIGDSYMAAGGLPYETNDHANKMIMAAKDIAAFVAKAKLDDKTTATFDVRIGINTGPVVAGVVGTKKFAYDIWGDTVNIASRMESSSEPGRINISESTYNLIKADHDCEYRGKIPVKNHGKVNMYFVN